MMVFRLFFPPSRNHNIYVKCLIFECDFCFSFFFPLLTLAPINVNQTSHIEYNERFYWAEGEDLIFEHFIIEIESVAVPFSGVLLVKSLTFFSTPTLFCVKRTEEVAM